MKVSIKSFEVQMDVKTKGIEFQVNENDGTLRGDCVLTKTGLIWCEGKTTPKNGKRVSWDKFIRWMNEELK